MTIQVCAGFATAALLLAEPAMGHMAQVIPTSRQVSFSGLNSENLNNLPNKDNAPWGYNSGGVIRTIGRGNANVDPAVMEDYGGGGSIYPLLHTPFADNGNMLEPNEIAKRHFVCGDPRIGLDEDLIPYSTPNNEWEPLTTYYKGQVIEMELHVRYYHKGHVEFSICDTADLGAGDVATQECFNRYPLTRADDDDYNSPIDPKYPGRYYVPPPCVAHEHGQDINENVDFDQGDGYNSYNVKVRYNLPEITCTHCVLQMHYFTGHRCAHIGYAEFNPSSWGSECAPDWESWMLYPGMKEPEAICGTPTTSYHSINYPEEFWSCSDITIESAEGLVPVTQGSPDDACSAFGGIYDDHEDGNVCCAAACLACAPDGGDCRGRSGGSSDCCPHKIRKDAARCSPTNSAPCTL